MHFVLSALFLKAAGWMSVGGVDQRADLCMKSPVYDRHPVGRLGCVTVSYAYIVPAGG